jgi:Zn finger protein HypA/HybF involved in hydrogenase expression
MTHPTFKISFPTDQGFWGRECKLCNKYFKIDSEKIKDNLFCPYCGELQPNDNLWTKRQIEEIEKISQKFAKRVVEDELDKMLKSLTQGSKYMSYKSGNKTQISQPLFHLEKEVDTQIQCPKCNMIFQVYGIFGFCPGCREDTVIIYEANLDILLQEIENSSDEKRDLRHAYNDLISTFESYCKKVSEKNNLGNANFQNLKNTRDLFKKKSLDIYHSVSGKEKIVIKRVFEKRHAYQHSKGKITEVFIKNVPEDYKLLGTTAVLSKEEFLQAVAIIKKIIINIRNKYGC